MQHMWRVCKTLTPLSPVVLAVASPPYSGTTVGSGVGLRRPPSGRGTHPHTAGATLRPATGPGGGRGTGGSVVGSLWLELLCKLKTKPTTTNRKPPEGSGIWCAGGKTRDVARRGIGKSGEKGSCDFKYKSTQQSPPLGHREGQWIRGSGMPPKSDLSWGRG